MDCIIPLKPIPNNTTTYKVPVDDQNVSLTFRTTYNEQAKYWLLDISNSEGEELIAGLPLVPAQDILEQFKYLKIGSAYLVPKSKVSEQWPGMDTLDDWYLIWRDTYVR